MRETETKQLDLLKIKKIRNGLSDDEKYLYEKLNKKYKNKDCFYIGSNGEWNKTKNEDLKR